MSFLDSLFKRGGDAKAPAKDTEPGATPPPAPPAAPPPPPAAPAKAAAPAAKKPMGLDEIMAVLQQIDAVMDIGADGVGVADASGQYAGVKVRIADMMKIMPDAFKVAEQDLKPGERAEVAVENLFEQLAKGKAETTVGRFLADVPSHYLKDGVDLKSAEPLKIPLHVVVSSLSPDDLKARTTTAHRTMGIDNIPTLFTPEGGVKPPSVPGAEIKPPAKPKAAKKTEAAAKKTPAETPKLKVRKRTEQENLAAAQAEAVPPAPPPPEPAPAAVPETPPVAAQAEAAPPAPVESAVPPPAPVEAVVPPPPAEPAAAPAEVAAQVSEPVEQAAPPPSEPPAPPAPVEAVAEAPAPVEPPAAEAETVVPPPPPAEAFAPPPAPVEPPAAPPEPEVAAPAAEVVPPPPEPVVEQAAPAPAPAVEEPVPAAVRAPEPVAEAPVPAAPMPSLSGLVPTVMLKGANLNTAEARDLVLRIDGIGDQLAERIVEDRKKNGPFFDFYDLARVPGIGRKAFERITGHPWREDVYGQLAKVNEVLGPWTGQLPDPRKVADRFRNVPGFEGCAILHRDGHLLAANWEGKSVEALEAMAPQIVKRVAQYMKHLYAGDTISVTACVEGKFLTFVQCHDICFLGVGGLKSLSRRQVQIVHGLGMALGYRFSGARGA